MTLGLRSRYGVIIGTGLSDGILNNADVETSGV